MTSLDEVSAQPQGALYRTIWRWHFYAGLICLPFFVLLATTGALYLYRDPISLIVEHQRLFATDVGPSLSADELVRRAAATQPGSPVRYTPPPAPGRSAEVGIREHGEIVSVFLDPATGRVLDRIADEARPMKVVSHIHSLEILGPVPNLVIEVVAGWAIVLVISGVYLWWPRGRTGGVVTVRASPAKRLWWRDLHAVTGVFAGAILLFLAVTGMPWSGFWGENFRILVNNAGLGMPAATKSASVASDAALAAVAPGSWTMDPSAAPSTGPHPVPPLSLARVLDMARRLDMAPGFVVRLPASPGGVFTLQSYPETATGQRVVHLDQYSGKVIADVGFRDYGPVSKVVEMGIAIHTGGQFGHLNRLLMLLGCFAIIGLSVTGATMWWKRRPRGQVAAPPRLAGSSVSIFAGIGLVVGLIFPLLGLSILAAFLIDRLIPASLRLRRAL